MSNARPRNKTYFRIVCVPRHYVHTEVWRLFRLWPESKIVVFCTARTLLKLSTINVHLFANTRSKTSKTLRKYTKILPIDSSFRIENMEISWIELETFWTTRDKLRVQRARPRRTARSTVRTARFYVPVVMSRFAAFPPPPNHSMNEKKKCQNFHFEIRVNAVLSVRCSRSISL